ncbi:hypothetical protein ACQCX2_07715 [Propionibacteriaceae bacterium Y1700]|uniref:hypothetical protein n=1 Tax=Microlunatus sp. Y1700 TaxID=3418487 RepID=UPI003DA714BA
MADIDLIRGALDFLEVGDRITSDTIRPALDAGQVPPQQVGPLMGHAVRLGWLVPTGRIVTSARRSRRGSYLREYKITASTAWKESAA